MKWLTIALLLGALALALLPSRTAAASDMYLRSVSAPVNGISVIQFEGVNGAARTSDRPRVGWVEQYTETDCWLTWCGGVEFVQDEQTVTAEWI